MGLLQRRSGLVLLACTEFLENMSQGFQMTEKLGFLP